MTEVHITERELLAMVEDLKDAHAESMPRFQRALSELSDATTGPARRTAGRPASRRSILVAGGAALGGTALAACSSSKKTDTAPSAPVTSAGGTGSSTSYEGDFRVVALASALENAAVFAYQAGIDAATKGVLGTVPPAIVTFVTTVQSQHKEHGAGWNAFLTKNGKKAITTIPLTIVADVQKQLAAIRSVTDLATVAQGLEDTAAATYITAAAGISAQQGIDVASTIAPVEAQHSAILLFVLGRYPVPNAVYSTKAAVGTDVFTG